MQHPTSPEAVFDDVVRHYQQFLDRRRDQRPPEEYRDPTPNKCTEFEANLVQRRDHATTNGWKSE